MNIKIYKLLKNSSILSSPGLLSIFLSLIAIPTHLEIAGVESYGNYIIFHFILVFSLIFNFGIGKSIAVSINNYPKKNKEISYQGMKYTFFIALFFVLIFYLFSLYKDQLFISNLLSLLNFEYLALGFIISIIYSSLEGILQGNQKFKSLSFYNFIFFSLSISLPSISLIYYSDVSLNNLIIFSLAIKFFTVVIMFILIIGKNLILKSNSKILLLNLKKNSKWLTLNNMLIHFYDLFDKYLVKIFLGPIAIATYTIPQQLTGKLSIFSKGFSAFLLPTLSRRGGDTNSFNYTLEIFLKIIPILIFLIFPLYEIFLNFWLKNNYNETILTLTKIFSLCSIFSCVSHLLITKFEASKTLNRNLKIEFILMPFFLIALYYLTSNEFTLIQISFLILLKELILLFFRLNLLKKDIKNVNSYYLYTFLLILALYLSINFKTLFLVFLILLIFIYSFKNDK
jgi:O-antigen/teichoic acid export membrane protein